jgi:hypothetical protein
LLGDARFRDLARRLRAGGLVSFDLLPPGGARRADEALAVRVAHHARFGPTLVELALSVGSALTPGASGEALDAGLRALAASAGAPRSVVALHDWSPSVLDAAREGRLTKHA